jgi:hypothetical protein
VAPSVCTFGFELCIKFIEHESMGVEAIVREGGEEEVGAGGKGR